MQINFEKYLLSVIIVNYNAPSALEKCLKSIDRFINVPKEVIIIDNNSQEEYLSDLCTYYKDIKIIRLPSNMGFGYANNVGVKNANGDIVLLINSDTILTDFSINDAINCFYKTTTKELWGFKLTWPDGQFQNSFSREIEFIDYILSYTPLAYLGKYLSRIKKHKYRGKKLSKKTEVPVIYATAILLERKDYLSLNGFSQNYFMYFEDVDFCDRFRKQLRGMIFYYPLVSIIHEVMGSSKNSKKINFEFLKSKYKYGFNKFGCLKVLLFILLDLTLIYLVNFIRRLKNTIQNNKTPISNKNE